MAHDTAAVVPPSCVGTIAGSVDISGAVQLLNDYFSPPTYDSVHGASAGIYKDGLLLLAIDPPKSPTRATPTAPRHPPSLPHSESIGHRGRDDVDFELFTGLGLDPTVGWNADNATFTATISLAPEPASLTLLAAGRGPAAPAARRR